jgi:hypothetical protein
MLLTKLLFAVFVACLKKNQIGQKIMKPVNAYLARRGFLVSIGTIVDATTPANVHDSQKWGSSYMAMSDADMAILRTHIKKR